MKTCCPARRWRCALGALISAVLGLAHLAGSRRSDKRRLRLGCGLLWLAGAAAWTLCLLREIRSDDEAIKP